MPLEAEDGSGKLHAQIESRRVLTPEGDHVAAEGEIVADEDGQAGAELNGHGFVIRGAKTEGGPSVAGFTVGELEDPEEDGAVSAERKAFLFDADLVLLQNEIEHVDELDMRDRFEGLCRFGHG